MSLEDDIAAFLASKPNNEDAKKAAPQDASSHSDGAPPEPGNDAELESVAEEAAGAEARPESRVEAAISRFKDKWGDLVSGRTALNLLVSPYEDDFSGMIQSESPSKALELAHDVFSVLEAQGKASKMLTLSLDDLFASVRDAKAFRMTQDENLPENELVVINGISDFRPALRSQQAKANARFMIERLSHIVDNRYVLLVGTKAELEFFLSQSRKLRFLFEDHLIELADEAAPSSGEEAYNAFVSCISPELVAQIDGAFKAQFDAYVARNERDLPFKGAELGDYLAKQCNASGELVLPKGRSFESAQDSLDKLIGIDSVKRTMRDIAKYAVAYERDIKNGLNPPKEKFHMVFSGPPGTGKTTVGKIAAEILYEAGVIPTANQLTVSADELVDPAIGKTAIKTQEMIDEARGGVLFIDEAYSLVGTDGSNINGSDAISQLILAMENMDDLVVIFGGYRDEMAQMVKTNPGFKSRISFNLDFESFSPEELLAIFDKMADEAKFEVDEQARNAILNLIAFFAPQRGFGNARFMRQVFHRAYMNRAVRLVDNDLMEEGERGLILAEDIPSVTQMLNYEREEDSTTSEEEIGALVGLDDVKEKVREFRTTMRYRELARKHGLNNPKQTLHMVFTGNPGTGKTTVARIIAKILFECGVTATPHYKEASAQDLIGEYVGHTGSKTKSVLEDALGGVLFIDEAYAIGYNSSFGQDAVAEIVKFMEDYRDQIVIIFAGYTQEINEFLSMNPGLASRVGYQFEFKDYDTDELQSIFELKIKGLGYTCTDEALERTRDVFRYFHSVENFGNGRFVDKVIQSVLSRHADNVGDGPMDTLSAEDIPSNKEMCKLVSLPVHEPLEGGDEGIRRIAIHEMGHAVCGLELLGTTGMKLVTIEEEATGALGYVEYEKDAFPALPTRETLVNRIAMCMGGMAAEELFAGDYSAGNSSDLEQATTLAVMLVTRYGMSPEAGYVSYPLHRSMGSSVPDVSALPEEERAAIRVVLAESLDKARDVLERNREKHARLTKAAISERTISGERMAELWKEIRDES